MIDFLAHLQNILETHIYEGIHFIYDKAYNDYVNIDAKDKHDHKILFRDVCKKYLEDMSKLSNDKMIPIIDKIKSSSNIDVERLVQATGKQLSNGQPHNMTLLQVVSKTYQHLCKILLTNINLFHYQHNHVKTSYIDTMQLIKSCVFKGVTLSLPLNEISRTFLMQPTYNYTEKKEQKQLYKPEHIEIFTELESQQPQPPPQQNTQQEQVKIEKINQLAQVSQQPKPQPQPLPQPQPQQQPQQQPQPNTQPQPQPQPSTQSPINKVSSSTPQEESIVPQYKSRVDALDSKQNDLLKEMSGIPKTTIPGDTCGFSENFFAGMGNDESDNREIELMNGK